MCIYRITFYHRKINSRPGIYTQKFVFVTLAHAAVHFVKSIYNCKISIRSGKTNINVYIRIYKRNPLSTHFILEKKTSPYGNKYPGRLRALGSTFKQVPPGHPRPFPPTLCNFLRYLSLSHVLHITNSLSLLALGTY